MPSVSRFRKHSLEEFCKGLKKYDRFLLSCHIAPEGDAIGSILAMDSLLRRMGKKTWVVCEDPFPARLEVIKSSRWNELKNFKKGPSDFQALVVADCPTLNRIGRVKDLLSPETVLFNVDHHISNENFAHYNYVCPKASASGEAIIDIFKHLKLPIQKNEAKNLYVAMSTDTGNFKHGNTTDHSHRVIAELMQTGINIDAINEQVYATFSLNKIQLYSRLFARVQTEANGQIAWVSMKREDLSQSGADYEDAEGFVDFLKYLREVKIAFFILELPDGEYLRVSFRSKGKYDVNKIASSFQGGGHKKASGCRIRSTISEAEKMILRCIQKEYSF